jgi:chromosome partitioning protein
MSTFLKFTNSKPTNKELGIFRGNQTEAAIRAFSKSHPVDFERLVNDFKGEKYSFLTAKEYVDFHFQDEDNKEEIIEEIAKKVLNKEMPGTFYVDGNGKETLFLPTIYPYIEDIIGDLDNMKKTKVICFGNYKGGVGKTTNVCNIAATLAYLGKKVLIIDNDVQGNCTSSFGYVREDFKYTLVELITMLTEPNIEDILTESIVSIDTNGYFKNGINGSIDLIPNSPVVMELAEDLPTYSRNLGTMENTLKKLISSVKHNYDYIFIDLPPAVNLFLRMSIMASDYFVFSLTPETFSDEGIPSIIRPVLKQANIYKSEIGAEYKILGAINCKFEAGRVSHDITTNNSNNTLNELLGEDCGVFDTYIPKSKIFDDAQLLKCSAGIFLNPTDRVVRNYFDLTKDIITKIYIEENK